VQKWGTNEKLPVLVTELLPLGPFATWQAERAVGDHDGCASTPKRIRLNSNRASRFESFADDLS
jgi:hypothetical protein